MSRPSTPGAGQHRPAPCFWHSSESIEPVTEEDARTAYLHLLLPVRDQFDALYLLACANLLNRYVKEAPQGSEFVEHYAFKEHVARIIETVIERKIAGVSVGYSDSERVWYASVGGLQFSFHNVPMKRRLREYAKSPRNKAPSWSGVRLQPVALPVFRWARRVWESRSFDGN